MNLVIWLFWLSAAAILYIYVGYSLLINLLAKLAEKPVKKAPNDLSVTIIMSVYNEAPRLAEKIRNIQALEGESRITQILIGSDGSSDDPEAALRDVEDPRAALFAFSERRGKPSVLNDLISHARGDVLVMMDARQRIDSKALTALLDNFSDPSVGVVSGELVFEHSETDTASASSIGSYWTFEKRLRSQESRIGSVPGATGALYAIRRELALPISPNTALDDVIIPMLAIKQGYRCLFEPAALVYDTPNQDIEREAIRKRRTLAGCVQLLKLHPSWIFPGGHPIWWQFSSHKIARLYSPFLLIALFIFSVLLRQHSFFYACTVLQVLGYFLAVLGKVIGPKKSVPAFKLLNVAAVFLTMQITLVRAWIDGLSRNNLALWVKAETASTTAKD